MKEPYARGMVVQEELECPFAPTLTAQPDERAAGSTESSAAEPTPAAAAGSAQTTMAKQIEALQRELAAVQESVTRDLEVLAISAGRPDEATAAHAPPQVALGDFEAGGLIAGGFAILRQGIPY